MNIFDGYIKETLQILDTYEMKPLEKQGALLGLVKRPSFLMDKDTAVELGGYPKESVNLIVGTSDMEIEDGIFVIGDVSLDNKTHVSFGKAVLIQTEDFPDEKIYDFTQETLMTDTSLRFEDVMLRTSPKHYYTNLKVSKKAMANGFSFDKMAETVQAEFKKISGVKKVMVVLFAGNSPIYKQLLPIAENVKDVTVTLNHIFDGIDMDCGSCAWSDLCDEVEGLRELHKRKNA